MPHRGEAHAAALPRIARASLPCRACLAAVSRVSRCRVAAAIRRHTAHDAVSPPPRAPHHRCAHRVRLTATPPRRSAALSRRAVLPSHSTAPFHRSALPSRHAASPLCRSALPSRRATPSRRPAAALCAFSHGSLFCRPSRRPVTPFNHPVRHPGATMQHRHAASPLAAPTVRKSPKLFNIVPYLKPEAH